MDKPLWLLGTISAASAAGLKDVNDEATVAAAVGVEDSIGVVAASDEAFCNDLIKSSRRFSASAKR